jgi:hypothetical protein
MTKSISRRTMLAAAPAAAAALAVTVAPAAALAGGGDDAPLFFLLDAYAEAKADSDAAWEDLGDLENSDEGEKPLTPIGIHRSGEVYGGRFEISPTYPDEWREKAAEEIARTHERLRVTHLGQWSRSAVPDFADAMAAELDASEQRALAALDAAVAAIKASPRGMALAAANARCETADAALAHSRGAIIGHRPATLAGAEAKIAWLLGLDLVLPTGETLREEIEDRQRAAFIDAVDRLDESGRKLAIAELERLNGTRS